jgi:hypothetical protein
VHRGAIYNADHLRRVRRCSGLWWRSQEGAVGPEGVVVALKVPSVPLLRNIWNVCLPSSTWLRCVWYRDLRFQFSVMDTFEGPSRIQHDAKGTGGSAHINPLVVLELQSCWSNGGNGGLLETRKVRFRSCRWTFQWVFLVVHHSRFEEGFPEMGCNKWLPLSRN